MVTAMRCSRAWLVLSALLLAFCGGGGGSSSEPVTSPPQTPTAPNSNPQPTDSQNIAVALGTSSGLTQQIVIDTDIAITLEDTSGACSITETRSVPVGRTSVAISGIEGTTSNCVLMFRAVGITNLISRTVPTFTLRIAPVVTERSVVVPARSTTPAASITVTFVSNESGVISFPTRSSCTSASADGTRVTANESVTLSVTGRGGAALPEGVITDCIIRVTASADQDATEYVVGAPQGFVIDVIPTLNIATVPASLSNTELQIDVTTNVAGTLSFSGCYLLQTAIGRGTTRGIQVYANAAREAFDYGRSYSCTVTLTGSSDSSETAQQSVAFAVSDAITIVAPTALNTRNPTVATTVALAGTLSYQGNCRSSTTEITQRFSGNLLLRPTTGASYTHADTVSDCVVTFTGSNGATQSVAVPSFTIALPFVVPTISVVIATTTGNRRAVSLALDQSAADYLDTLAVSYSGDCDGQVSSIGTGASTIAITTQTATDFAPRTTAYSCVVTFQSSDGRTTAVTIPFVIASYSLTGVLATINKDDTTISVTLTSSDSGVVSVVSGSRCAFRPGSNTSITANTPKTFILTGVGGGFAEGQYTDCRIRASYTGTSSADYVVGGQSGFTIDLTPTLLVTDIASALASTTPSVNITANLVGTLSYSSGCASTITSITTANTARTVAIRADSVGAAFDYAESYSCTITFTATSDTSEQVSVTKTFSIPAAISVASASDLDTETPTIAVTAAVAGTLSYSGNCRSATTVVTASYSSSVTLMPSTGIRYSHGDTVSDCRVTFTDRNGAQQSQPVGAFTINTPFVAPTVTSVALVAAANSYSVQLRLDHSSADFVRDLRVSYSGACQSNVNTISSSTQAIPITTTANTNFAGRTAAYNCTVTFTSSDGRAIQRPVSFTLSTVNIAGSLATIAKGDSSVRVTLTSTANATVAIVAGSSCAFVANTSTSITANVATTVTVTGVGGGFAEGTYTDCIIRAVFADSSTASYQVGGASGFTIDLSPQLTIVQAVPTRSSQVAPSLTLSSNVAGTLSYGGSCYSQTSAITASTNTTILLQRNSSSFYTGATGPFTDCTITVTATADSEQMAVVVPAFSIDDLLFINEIAAENLGTRDPQITITSTYGGAGYFYGTGSCVTVPSTVDITSASPVVIGLRDPIGRSYSDASVVSGCIINFFQAGQGVVPADTFLMSVRVPEFTVDRTPLTVIVIPSSSTTAIISLSANVDNTTLTSSNCQLATTTLPTRYRQTNIAVLDADGNAFSGGWHSCAITATAGIQQQSVNAAFYVDVAPTMTVTLENVGSIVGNAATSGTPTVSVTVSESVALSYSSACGGPSSLATGSHRVTITAANGSSLAAGNHDCVITATDSTGNTVTNTVQLRGISTDAPTLRLVSFTPAPRTLLSGATDNSLADQTRWRLNVVGTNTATGRYLLRMVGCSTTYSAWRDGTAQQGSNLFAANSPHSTNLEIVATNGQSFAPGQYSCHVYIEEVGSSPRIISNIVTLNFTVVANETTGTNAGYQPTCPANRLRLTQLWAGTAECTAFTEAERLLPLASRIPGYAQLHYDAEREIGPITAENSRLSVVDDFNACNWEETSWRLCWRNDGYHGNLVVAVTEAIHGVSTRECNVHANGSNSVSFDRLFVGVRECSVPGEIINFSYSPTVSGSTVNVTYANAFDVFFALPTGNCSNDHCSGVGRHLFNIEPEQHLDPRERANPNPIGSATHLRTLLQAHRAILVTGVYLFFEEDSLLSPATSVADGSALAYAQLGISTPCGSEWEHCVATSYTYPLSWIGQDFTVTPLYLSRDRFSFGEGTSFSTPAVASALAVLLHRWPRLWTPGQAPEQLVDIVYDCATYDNYRYVAASTSSAINGQGATLLDLGSVNIANRFFRTVYDFNSSNSVDPQTQLGIQNLRRVIGRGIVQFDCLYQPNGVLLAAPPSTSTATVTTQAQHDAVLEAIEATVTEDTSVAQYTQAVAQAESDRLSALEAIAKQSGSYVPTTTGQLHLTGVAGIERLSGYDSYGRDFDRTPSVTSGVECQDFYGQIKDLTFAFCDNTVRMSHRLSGYLNIGWFISNSSFNGSFGTDDLRFGDSVGVQVEFNKSYYLGNKTSLHIASEFNAGHMFSVDQDSYLRSYQAYSIDIDLGLTYKGFSFSVRHQSGSHGELHILNHELDLIPQDDTYTSMRYKLTI